MKHKGAEFLDFSFQKISEQTYRNLFVSISDHCSDNRIEDVARHWADRIEIRYQRKTYNRENASDNMNVAMKNCEGADYIKLLFQDDFLYDEYAIENTVKVIEANPEAKWFTSACQHSDESGLNFTREFHPAWNDKIVEGVNTISSPSVITLKNDDSLQYFDLNLFWLMDTDLYHRYHEKYGEPVIINEVTIANRLWGSQATNTLSDERKNNEHEYIKQKYCLPNRKSYA